MQAFFTYIETIKFTKTDVFEAFQRELIRVSKLNSISPKIRALCAAEPVARKEWSPLPAAWIAADVSAPAGAGGPGLTPAP